MKLPSVDRRSLLIGGGVTAGLIVAFYAWPRFDSGPVRAGEKDQAFNAYLRIANDGKVTLAVPQAETGQDRKSTRLNSSHIQKSRMPSSA